LNGQRVLFRGVSWYGRPVISQERPLVLSSRSPRRSALLGELELPFVVRPVSIDETPRSNERALEYVERISAEKMHAARVSVRALKEPYAGILVADTTVVLDGEILGKPQDVAESLDMVSRLCGREHEVLTAYALYHAESEESRNRVVASKVRLRAATRVELEAYAATGEGLDKAGSYAVQGRGAFLVEAVIGSYTNVVGLPLCELVLDMKSLGLLGSYP
jgi:septum formation protein